MSSILPAANPATVGLRKVPMAKTWDWDMETLEYKTDKGKMIEVYENDAIRIWIWKIIATERSRWPVYSHSYGNELLTLIGRGYSSGFIAAEAKRIIKEAIMNSLADYVTDIRNIKVSYANRHLQITLTVDTIYSRKAVMAFDI